MSYFLSREANQKKKKEKKIVLISLIFSFIFYEVSFVFCQHLKMPYLHLTSWHNVFSALCDSHLDLKPLSPLARRLSKILTGGTQKNSNCIENTNTTLINDGTIQFSSVQSLSSVQFSRSVVSGSLGPHESQHARPPCPSPTPGVYSDSCP